MMHFTNRLRGLRWSSLIMLVAAVGLTAIGILIQSGAYDGDHIVGMDFQSHLIAVAVALVSGLLCYLLRLHRFFRSSTILWFPYLLFVLLTINLWGKSVSGSRSFLDLGIMTLRPVVLLPFALIMALSWLQNRSFLLREDRTFKEWILPIVVILLCIYTIFLQHWRFMLLVPPVIACAGFLSRSRSWLLWAYSAFILLMLFLTIGYFISPGRMLSQLENWLSFPGVPNGSSYGGWILLETIAAGGIWGNGFGEVPLSLPNWQTDYVFATVCFQGGQVTAMATLLFLLLFALAGIGITKHSHEAKDQFLCGGLTSLLFLAGCWTVAGNLACLPGFLPSWMPFVGYGEMLQLLCWCSVGMMLAIDRSGYITTCPHTRQI